MAGDLAGKKEARIPRYSGCSAGGHNLSALQFMSKLEASLFSLF